MEKRPIFAWLGAALLLASLGIGRPARAVSDQNQLAIENPCTWQGVTCTPENLKDGGFITMTSADPDQVKNIQAHAAMMAQAKACASPGAAAGGKMMTGCPSAWPHVSTLAENLANGAKISWTSPDPGQAAKIQEHLKMIAGMKHMADDELVTCPVTGTKIRKSQAVGSVVYKGKTYYFCCPGCDQQFLKDPEKYLQRLEPKK